ncbi:MAG: molecular chaperone HtpG [Thermodesulfobacteriota bacterium]
MTTEHPVTETLEFQAEVKKVLDIVIHSLYTEREIFVRELVSNAADACERQRHLAVVEQEIFDAHVPLEISLAVDDKAGTLTITDTGVGMTREELVANLGTIAHSGSRAFLAGLAEAAAKDLSLIGQFGVGFYSAFMAAKKVRVLSRSYRPDAQGCEWTSDGSTYTVQSAPGLRRGTRIIIELRDDAKEFADAARIKRIIRQYSNFVPFPILMDGEKLNTIQALWTRSKSEIEDKEYTEFYKFIANAMDEPLTRLHFATDAPLAIRALLFVPQDNFERLGFGRSQPGVNLYCQRVLIEQHSANILPDWLRFLKGVVDSDDLPLNISRQALQDSTLVSRIKRIVTGRFLKHLEEEAKNSPETFASFWKTFGVYLKEGVTTDFAHRDELARLLRFQSSSSEGEALVSLDDYLGRMAEGQKEIYYINGPNRAAIEAGPYVEAFRSRNIEILYTLDPLDDFVLTQLGEYRDKKLTSADRAELELPPAAAEEARAEEAPLEAPVVTSLTGWMRALLGERVSEVRESKRLVDSPAMVVSQGGMLTASMERILRAANQDLAEMGPKILEINTHHPMIKSLAQLRLKDEAFAGMVVEQIFDNAMVQAGLLVDSRKLVERVYAILDRTVRTAE